MDDKTFGAVGFTASLSGDTDTLRSSQGHPRPILKLCQGPHLEVQAEDGRHLYSNNSLSASHSSATYRSTLVYLVKNSLQCSETEKSLTSTFDSDCRPVMPLTLSARCLWCKKLNTCTQASPRLVMSQQAKYQLAGRHACMLRLAHTLISHVTRVMVHTSAR